MDKKYNGWTNFETWKVNLEFFDGLSINDLFHGHSILDLGKDKEERTYNLSQSLKNLIEEHIEDESKESFTQSLALAFISNVNYYEIASHMVENEMEEA
jgi:hypothetical protein